VLKVSRVFDPERHLQAAYIQWAAAQGHLSVDAQQQDKQFRYRSVLVLISNGAIPGNPSVLLLTRSPKCVHGTLWPVGALYCQAVLLPLLPGATGVCA
jgi:hypothetical protein